MEGAGLRWNAGIGCKKSSRGITQRGHVSYSAFVSRLSLLYAYSMRFPDYDAYPSPHESLIDSYIRHIARHEPRSLDQYRAAHGDISELSVQLGRSCMQIAHGSERLGNRSLVHTTATIDDRLSRAVHRSHTYNSLKRLQLLAGIVLHREDVAETTRRRQELHAELTQQLAQANARYAQYWNTQAPAACFRRVTGDIAELTACTLFTRLAHPWMLALPSLKHHDLAWGLPLGAEKRSYDVSLLETGPAQRHTNDYRLQVKLGCVGLCNEPATSRHAAVRADYSADVVLVSGHCDMGLQRYDDNLIDTRIPDALVREVTGEATPEEIDTLDVVTNTLLLDITANTHRRSGTAQLAPSP